MKQVWPTRHAHTNVYGRYYFNREQVGKKQQLRALRQSTKFSVAKTKLGGWDDRRTMMLKTEKQSYHWLYRLEDPTGYSTTWWQELQLRSLDCRQNR